jgi:hypothetical protein
MGDGLQVPLNINLKSQEAVPNLRKAKIITAIHLLYQQISNSYTPSLPNSRRIIRLPFSEMIDNHLNLMRVLSLQLLEFEEHEIKQQRPERLDPLFT